MESFNSKFRGERLALESIDTLLEAKILTVRWRRCFNALRTQLLGLPGSGV